MFENIEYDRRMELKYAALQVRKNFFITGNEEDTDENNVVLSNIPSSKFVISARNHNFLKTVSMALLAKETIRVVKKALETELTDEEETYVALHAIFGSDKSFMEKYRNMNRDAEATAKLYSSVNPRFVKARYKIVLQNNAYKREAENYIDNLVEKIEQLSKSKVKK